MDDFLGSVGLGIVNSGLSWLGSEIQSQSGRKNLDYMMDRYYSPKAQVNNLASAGINPAVAMGNQSPVMSSAGQIPMPDAPSLGIGTSSLADIGNYIKALADAKKSGAETDKALAEADAVKLQNDLTREFGRKSWILDVSQKYQNVILAKKTNDIKEQEKAINEFKKATEKAISESKGIEKKMLEKRFGNLDIQIDLENKLQTEKINTEKSVQTAQKAAANASNTQASVNREMARYQRVLADVEESSSPFKLENLLRHYRASNMISDVDYEEAYRRYERLRSINEDNDKHEWNKALDAFMFYLEEHVKGLSPFVSAASTNYSTK